MGLSKKFFGCEMEMIPDIPFRLMSFIFTAAMVWRVVFHRRGNAVQDKDKSVAMRWDDRPKKCRGCNSLPSALTILSGEVVLTKSALVRTSSRIRVVKYVPVLSPSRVSSIPARRTSMWDPELKKSGMRNEISSNIRYRRAVRRR